MTTRVLVTGVAGMIGSHLLDALLSSERYDVVGIDNMSFGNVENIAHVLDHPRFKFYRVDILDFETLKILGKDVDTIVHLAAVKKIGEADSSLPTLRANVKGTEHILEVAKMWRAKLVFASTSDVYGMSPELPHNEDGDLLLGPSMIKRWSYAISKLYGEQLAFGYHADFGVPLVVIRYFGGFSPRSSFAWSGGHVPIFINAILKGQEVIVHGDGSQTRSMAYVTDLVDGTLLAMENPRAVGQIINIGNDEELSVLDTAKLIHAVIDPGTELRIRFVPFSEVFGKYKDIVRRVPDLEKARTLLGYTPKVPLRRAIELTIDEIRKRRA